MSDRATLAPAAAVLVAGVAAALHVGKLPPALPALQQALGLTLVEAGFLLSLVQGAGMFAGVLFGVLADGLGGRRSVLAGLLLLALASAAGGTADGAGGTADGAGALLALRAVEGCGFLLVVLPAPGLLRALVPPDRVAPAMGLWGAYMPLATALALLFGPPAIAAFGWRAWWWLLGGLSALAALLAWRFVPSLPRPASAGWTAPLAQTLAAPGPWLVATTFAMYSGQWLAVVGFLPTLYAQAGLAPALTGVLTAGAAAVNMVGNLFAGRLLHRGWAPQTLLRCGFVAMALGAALAFAAAAPPALRYAAVLVFSGCGGLIPATLFAQALRVAPTPGAVSATIGWVQQWSAFGQFAGPPLAAWVASRAGGWHWTAAVTGACSLAGLLLVGALARRLRA